ncbi:uncharacterized protein LOC120698425 [Panicum virgatum]|uniref:uncharacterized protein LOC120698425 n=1 Tax=Panicum virgatum TaxID=38727 RepID=UPI0019D63EC0|nr:uncharacterized protein LOC120698425 [Panicum virgatum]
MDDTDGRGKPDSRDEAHLGDEGAESEQDGHCRQHRLGILRGHTFIHLGNRPFSFLSPSFSGPMGGTSSGAAGRGSPAAPKVRAVPRVPRHGGRRRWTQRWLCLIASSLSPPHCLQPPQALPTLVCFYKDFAVTHGRA